MITQYDFELNKEMVYLIETLKVESYWSKKNFTLTLQNKDIPLLNHIEKIVNNLGIKVSKRILLKIRLEDNTQKKSVKLYNKNQELNFHIERSPFNAERVKAVTSLPFKKKYEILLKTKENKYPLILNSRLKKIDIECELESWAYGDLRFPTKKLLDFLDIYLKGNKNIQIEELLLSSHSDIIMSAFSALVDCEGTINWYGLKRNIQIRMNSKDYLLQWKSLLEKYKIGCRFEKNDKNLWGLVISGWEDFDRLEKLGFKLIHSRKAKKWKEMMKGYKRNQISRGTYKEFYIKKMKEVDREITTKELSEITGKSKRTINYFLLRLEKEDLLICNRSKWPYLYSISK
ncbi:MAG: LAGLIDADG family homing endonuclease [Nanoarchaeota archaeon]|nr:LAGLIDADG family homing endonuclease [Nanoarchaeota archaeon]